MKVNVDLVLQMRRANAWSQDELATASGLNLRTIQRIEKEATASLQSMKALASVFGIDVRALEYEERAMINELVGKNVLIEMGVSISTMSGSDKVKGEIVEIDGYWVKLKEKSKLIYINANHIKKIIPQ